MASSFLLTGVVLSPLQLPLLLIFLLLPSSLEVSLGGGGTPLYNQDDKILILNSKNFQPNICSSSKAWVVEFYSSWCGHCIHFAPTFKEFATDVFAWRDVISVAAIDCAMEENMPTCREYEVMGYPILKFFTPNTPTGDMGIERLSKDNTVPAIKKDMIEFITDLQLKKFEKAGQHWPSVSLVPASVNGLEILHIWDQNPTMAVLLIEEAYSTMGSEVILDLSGTLTKLKVPLVMAKIEINAESDQLLQKLTVSHKPSLVAISRDSILEVFPLVAATRIGWSVAIKDFILRKSSELSLNNQMLADLSQKKPEDSLYVQPLNSEAQKIATRKELINRRYKVFTSDLEKAVIYSISHEVAQHSSISGHTLQTLLQYVTVLEKFFPARIEMSVFLRDLHSWVNMHQDTIRGEDLSSWMESYQGRHGIRASKDWVGCRGSEDQFGGYPCGLWSVWHALTINQANLAEGDPKEVMNAMKSFIQEFFGCRDCARHFDQAIEGGKAFDEIENYNDAVLLLWKTHNRANFRLAGDISEDPVFPKLVFPSKEFCSGCYGALTGTNLWDEFDRIKVVEFLKNLYSKEKLSSQGLTSDTTADGHALAVAPLAQIDDNFEHLDVSNFKKKENSTSFVFFNGADISICFLLWFVSALLLLLIYLKFIAGKKFSNSHFFSNLKRKTSMNPLLGKV
eukprot:GFUD01008415.1.p1 GENE.GFUD01008415.1~~GFUD01008415.1.p1  ORF type:complete len:681 (-),score=161.46 GFUD01008415.1:240-2282(-)